MSETRPKVNLGKFLTPIDNIVSIDDDSLYKQVTVRMHNRGLVLRQECMGKEIKTKKQYQVRFGQLVYSRIDARNGAMGLVPSELDCAIVSNDFPVFDINCKVIDPHFFNYFISTETFITDCLVKSKGTSNRRRLKVEDFLFIEIPLPPLEDQQRIVEFVEILATRITELERLQNDVLKLCKEVLNSSKNKVFINIHENGWPIKCLNEIAPINMGQSPVGNSYNEQGEGVPLLNGPTEFGDHNPKPVQWTTAPTKFSKEGDILICVRGATTGRMNWADQKYCIGRGLAAISVDPKYCLQKYVYYFVETQAQRMLDMAQGTTFPNLSGEKLKSLEIPVPPLSEQEKIVTYIDNLQSRVKDLEQLQLMALDEISAMLPAVLDRVFQSGL